MNARVTSLLVLTFFALSSQPVMAVERADGPDLFSEMRPQHLDAQWQSVYDNAARAIAGKDRRKADFWLARYLGVITSSAGPARGYADLIPLFDQREDLVPTAFISGRYSRRFLDFFVRGTYELWGVPHERVSEADAEFVTRTFSDGPYVVELVVSPVLEAWTIIGDNPSTAVIPLVSAEQPAVLVSGIRREGEPVRAFPRVALNANGNSLQHIWPIEAHDLEGDGTPEIWIRYNEAWADGFSQVLEIYKIEHEAALVLFKRFEGSAEGIARRVEDGTIEVAEGFTDQALTGHLGFDQHHIETFAFQRGEFVKVAERNVPHLLWSDAWEPYYFGERATEQTGRRKLEAAHLLPPS